MAGLRAGKTADSMDVTKAEMTADWKAVETAFQKAVQTDDQTADQTAD